MSGDTNQNAQPQWANDPLPASPPGHKLMFMGLACAAFCLFAPTVLLPVLHEHCYLIAEEARLTQRVAELEHEIQRQAELAGAFAHDAVINERLAILDLHYQKPNEVILPVLPRGYSAPSSRSAENPTMRGALVFPTHWPAWTHNAERWAADRGLVGVFLNPSLRPVFFFMSAGLVIAAFVLFAPTAPPRHRPRRQALSQDEPAVAHSAGS